MQGQGQADRGQARKPEASRSQTTAASGRSMRQLQSQVQAVTKRFTLLLAKMQAQSMANSTTQVKRKWVISAPVRAIAPARIMGFLSPSI
jgi:hypothetical protein